MPERSTGTFICFPGGAGSCCRRYWTSACTADGMRHVKPLACKMASTYPEASRSIRQHASMAASGMTSPCRSWGRAQKRLREVEPARAFLAFRINLPARQGDGGDLTGSHNITTQVVSEIAVTNFSTLISSDREVLV